jgi:hypothetical protein
MSQRFLHKLTFAYLSIRKINVHHITLCLSHVFNIPVIIGDVNKVRYTGFVVDFGEMKTASVV